MKRRESFQARGACALLLFSLAASAAAQQPAPKAAGAAESPSTWLRPSDAAFETAISDGFTGKSPGDKSFHGRFIEFGTNGIQPEPTSSFSLVPPLRCAFDMAQNAEKDLEDAPSVKKARATCGGVLALYVVHYSVALRAHWHAVLEIGAQRLAPTASKPDASPDVARFYGGFWETDETGYRYTDSFIFTPKLAWTSKVTILMADETGKRKAYDLDFSKLWSGAGTPGVGSK